MFNFRLSINRCPDRLAVRTLRCGRSNPGSNPGHGKFYVYFHSFIYLFILSYFLKSFFIYSVLEKKT